MTKTKTRIVHDSGLKAEARQAHLIEASGKYIRGEITRKEFRDAEREYGTDYSSATLALSGLDRQFTRVVERLVSLKRRVRKAATL